MDRKELEGKNKTDLVALATGLGFQVTPAMTKPQIIDVLSAAPAEPGLSPAAQLAAIVANADDPEAAAQQVAKMAEAAAKAEERKNPIPKEGKLRTLGGELVSGRKFKVTIMATEGETGDVKLGVNGHMIQIKRGVPVVIDEAYLEVLKNTIIHTVKHDDSTGTTVVQAMAIQRLPFSAEPV